VDSFSRAAVFMQPTIPVLHPHKRAAAAIPLVAVEKLRATNRPAATHEVLTESHLELPEKVGDVSYHTTMEQAHKVKEQTPGF